MQTTREKFLAIIEERYACRAMPAGGFTIIAEELGVSRERIRQFASQEGVTSPLRGVRRNPVKRVGCADCGKMLGYYAKSPRCGPCKKAANYITINCAGCGVEKSIYLPKYKNNIKQGKNKRGAPFCSPSCAMQNYHNSKKI